MTFQSVRTLPRYAAVAIALMVAPSAHADMVTFDVLVGSTAGGQPVDVTVTLTSFLNGVTVTLRNLEANPTSDIQAINGITFALSTGQTAGSISSSSAIMRTITGNGAGQYNDTGPSGTDWHYNQAGLGVEITALGTAHAPQTLIGDPNAGDAYAAANPSITNNGNGSHNPFLAGTATFNLAISGVTADTTFSGLKFEFGTAAGTNLTGHLVPSVPEPASITLLGGGLGLLTMFALRSRRRLLASPI
jgi:hypothetical protein